MYFQLSKKQASCVAFGTDAKCVCNKGYKGSGASCEDEDECAIGTHDCNPEATCTNTAGGFTCSCPADKIEVCDFTVLEGAYIFVACEK